MWEKIARPDEVRRWPGSFPVAHRYTPGVAGEAFLTALRDRGVILGTRCERCAYTYVPARLFCERCFAELDAVQAELAHPAPERALVGAGEPEVLGHGQVRGERGVLEHRGEAAGAGVGRRAELDRPAGHLDHAGVGAEHAAQDLDQRALAGPVGADQPVDLAPLDREVDRAEGHDRPVPLGDLAGAEQRCWDRYSPGPLQAKSCSGV